MNSLKINESDKENFLKILNDVRSSVSCEIGIGGSLSQRLLSPTIANLLEGKPLHDVDLILIGTNGQSPELPRLRKLFRVMEMIHSEGWYYGMNHRATGMWVDLFTPPYEQEFASVTIEGKEYKASTLENQILYLAHDILSRSKRKVPVRIKWINKLKLLNDLSEIDRGYIERVYELNKKYFETLSSEGTASLFIQKALEIKPSTWLEDKIFLMRWFFSRKVSL